MTLLFTNKLFTVKQGTGLEPFYNNLTWIPDTLNEEQKMFERKNHLRIEEHWHFIKLPSYGQSIISEGPPPPEVPNLLVQRPKLQL